MIELMVAMLIGLIGMIIIFQVFEVSEGIKRTTTSGGDAQQNGAVALYVIERDLRNAGMGFNDTPTAGCQIIGFDSKRAASTPSAPPDFPPGGSTMLLVPARIVSTGVSTDPDELTIFYGSKPHIVNATTLSATMANPTSILMVRNPYAYRPGDLILLQDPGTAKQCSIMEVTNNHPFALPVLHNNAGSSYTLTSMNTALARFNKPGGLGVTYDGLNANVTLVFNLGNIYDPAGAPDLPVHNTYSIVNKSLTVTSLFVPTLPATSPSPLVSAVADNIVHMRALYGVDDGPYNPAPGGGPNLGDGDGIVDRYVDAATFNAIVPLPWRYIIAVRVAVVARSALPEKPSEGASGCDATTDGTETPPGPDRRPKWSGGVFNLTADPEWKCYRYRVFETTVPLRNWIWRSS